MRHEQMWWVLMRKLWMRLAKLWHNRLRCSLIRGMYEWMLWLRWRRELINAMVRMCWVHIERVGGITGCRSCRSRAVHDSQHSWWDHSHWGRGFLYLFIFIMLFNMWFLYVNEPKSCSEIMNYIFEGTKYTKTRGDFLSATLQPCCNCSTSDHHVTHNTTLSSHCSPLLSL